VLVSTFRIGTVGDIASWQSALKLEKPNTANEKYLPKLNFIFIFLNKFTSKFPYYNAIPRAHNVAAETGGPASKTRQCNGLYYLLDQEPTGLRILVSKLQRDGIEIVRPPANGRPTHDQIFVDHQTRTALTDKTLEPDYTTAAIDAAITGGLRPAQLKRQQAKSREDTRYSANFPRGPFRRPLHPTGRSGSLRTGPTPRLSS